MADILKREGSFAAMEVKVKELWMKEEEQRTEGGWHTEISLASIGWTPFHVCTQVGTYMLNSWITCIYISIHVYN